MPPIKSCDELVGRMYDICRGTASGLTLRKCNAYRVHWGLAALPDDATPSAGTPAHADAPRNPLRPSLFQQVSTFAAALTAHLKDGLSKCDDDEIQARLRICQDCPEFTGSHCRKCGCACGGRPTFFNKLAWRSESCPLGNWQSETKSQ